VRERGPHDARADAHVLAGLAAAALVGVLAAWVLWRKRLGVLQHAGFALVVGGALGNLVDRAARGYVVDFIHVRWWPVFNVADVGVVAGVLMLLVFRARATREGGGSGRAGGTTPPPASA
jgi:signal peptidase II